MTFFSVSGSSLLHATHVLLQLLLGGNEELLHRAQEKVHLVPVEPQGGPVLDQVVLPCEYEVRLLVLPQPPYRTRRPPSSSPRPPSQRQGASSQVFLVVPLLREPSVSGWRQDKGRTPAASSACSASDASTNVGSVRYDLTPPREPRLCAVLPGPVQHPCLAELGVYYRALRYYDQPREVPVVRDSMTPVILAFLYPALRQHVGESDVLQLVLEASFPFPARFLISSSSPILVSVK